MGQLLDFALFETSGFKCFEASFTGMPIKTQLMVISVQCDNVSFTFLCCHGQPTQSGQWLRFSLAWNHLKKGQWDEETVTQNKSNAFTGSTLLRTKENPQ